MELQLKFRYGRTIFHPSESMINIVFLTAVSLKWLFFIISFLWCGVISFEYVNIDQAHTHEESETMNSLLYIFGTMQVHSLCSTLTGGRQF